MAVVIQNPPMWRRALPLVQGFDGPLLLAIALLSALGLLAMYSAAFEMPGRFETHARNLLIAAGVLFVVAQIPPQRWLALAAPLYLLGLALLLAVELVGIERNGAQRWLDLGLIVMQPSELMKLAMPMMLAWWFHKREGRLQGKDFVVAAVIVAVPTALILNQPDLGTSLLIASSGLFVIYFAGLSWKLIVPPALLGLGGIVALLVMEPQWCQPGVDWMLLRDYQKVRVCTLLNPTADPLGSGFHIIQSMIAIGSGGLWGQGLLQGTQTQLDFVLERTTDFIFAAYAEEFGFLGVLLLLGAYFYLVWRGLKIAVEAPTLFTRLLAGALTLVHFVYAFVNIGMVSGILPVVGLPLPFLSFGGTALLTLGASLGILLAIARARRLNQS
ncbi:MAG: ADP-ribosylglycohydrolase [Comamonadaceae bacterium BICA1-1]|nr:MAG: ADP-ribosylglycohydrolase [Comamonadaceae bacterium BICA1-1]